MRKENSLQAPPGTSTEENDGGRAGRDRIRTAVERNPTKMTLQLARELGVPEVEVIRALPDNRVVEGVTPPFVKNCTLRNRCQVCPKTRRVSSGTG